MQCDRAGSDEEAAARMAVAQDFERRGLLADAAECYERFIWAGARSRSLYARLAAVYRRQGRDDLADALTGPSPSVRAIVAQAPADGGDVATAGQQGRTSSRERASLRWSPGQGLSGPRERLLCLLAALRGQSARVAADVLAARMLWLIGALAALVVAAGSTARRLGRHIARVARGLLRAARGRPDRGARLATWRFFPRVPERDEAGTRANRSIAANDVEAEVQSLIHLGARWVGAVQAGRRRCAALRASNRNELRLSRLPTPDHTGGAWPRVAAPASGGHGLAATGRALRDALVLAVNGLIMVAVVVGIADTLRPGPVPGDEEPAVPPMAAAMVAALPSPPPESPAEPVEPQDEPDRVRVAGTEGHGANLRAEPGPGAPRVKSVGEGAVLEVVGSDRHAEGRTWRNVRDPVDGASGWMAAEFVAAAPP